MGNASYIIIPPNLDSVQVLENIKVKEGQNSSSNFRSLYTAKARRMPSSAEKEGLSQMRGMCKDQALREVSISQSL